MRDEHLDIDCFSSLTEFSVWYFPSLEGSPSDALRIHHIPLRVLQSIDKLHTLVLYLVFSDSIVFLPSAGNSCQMCFKLSHHLFAYACPAKNERETERTSVSSQGN